MCVEKGSATWSAEPVALTHGAEGLVAGGLVIYRFTGTALWLGERELCPGSAAAGWQGDATRSSSGSSRVLAPAHLKLELGQSIADGWCRALGSFYLPETKKSRVVG